MSKVVNDSYPNNTRQMSDEEIKAKFLAESTNTGTMETFQKLDVPTEIIDLPSRGYFYPEGHPLSNGKIEMKYMTAKEEDILASQNLIKQGVVIDKLLQSLIVTKINYNDLLTIDKNAIFIAARILGYGKDYEVEIECPKCSTKSKHNIDLQEFGEKEIDWTKHTKGECSHNFTLPFSKKELTLKFITHGDEKKIEDDTKAAKKLTKILGSDADLTTRLKNVIISVDGDSSVGTINKTVDTMLSRDSLALRTHIKNSTPDVDTTFTFSCPNCDHEQENMALPIGVSFFWPGV